MRTVRRILVAVKEPMAKRLPAVEKATQLARSLGADVELFHSISGPIFLGADSFDGGSLAEVQNARRVQVKSRLEAIASKIRKQGISVSTCADWDFPAGEAIVRRAARTRSDLIVADCHAGKHHGSWLLRLTDWELLRHSSVPVLLVKSARPYRNPVVLAAVDPGHAFAKPAKLDDEILSAAALVKRTLRGTLHAVHAYVPVPNDAKPSELLDPDATRTLDARARTHARQRLQPLLKKVTVPPGQRHLVGQHPINAIPDLAREIGCAILVMGAISRSGLKRLFIGNTAERILDEVGCDVLVVKAPGFASRIPYAERGTRVVMSPMPRRP
ncbi:MAG: universal stress protein [Gammaproteobacteria bacterium]